MCMQCAAGAAAALGSATGIRAWLAHRGPSWFTGRVSKVVTVALLGAGLLAAGLFAG